MQMDNNFLMGKQEYPSNVLAAKLPMTDFVAAMGAVKHKPKETDPTDVAFLVTKDEHKWYPIYYCCGEKYHGGCKKCLNVTKAV